MSITVFPFRVIGNSCIACSSFRPPRLTYFSVSPRRRPPYYPFAPPVGAGNYEWKNLQISPGENHGTDVPSIQDYLTLAAHPALLLHHRFPDRSYRRHPGDLSGYPGAADGLGYLCVININPVQFPFSFKTDLHGPGRLAG